jgi:2-dehydropantoate 2-reductase
MPGKNLKVAVMGAGSVGCYYGGMLARAGHPVTLIARPQHVAAIRRDGLLLDTRTFREYVPVDASSEAEALRGAQLVLCCVKSTDSEAAAQQMAPFIDHDAVVLSLQNGVDNAARLQAVLGRPVAPAVVYVATEMAGPGHVRHHGRGDLVVAPGVISAAMADLFVKAGVPIALSDNVIGALWAKLILNCAYNALSAISQIPYGRLFHGTGVEAVMRDVVDECLAVARAEGVSVAGDVWQNICDIAVSMPAQLSSTAQDVARGKPSEIDHLNGYIMRRGEALGIAVPVNRTLHTLVRLLETRNQPTA